MKIILASNNSKKIKELSALFLPLGHEIIPQGDLQIPEADEPFNTFLENALHKARHAAKISGLPAIADDSGLCVDALNGRPGVYSARYAPNRDFKQGMKMLLDEIKDTGSDNRKAHFSCCLALACPNQKTQIFEGRVDGTIAEKPRGNNGFGYDAIFIPEGYEKTFGELGDDVKNNISHRRLALEKFIKELK